MSKATPPFRKSASVARININDCTPRELFDKFVATRTPVIVTGHLDDNDWRGSLWSNAYLKAKAGASVLQIERRSEAGHFGQGIKQPMTFGDFIEKLDAGSEDYYMTTQGERVM